MPSPRELPRDFEPDPDGELAVTDQSFVWVGHSEYRPVNEWDAVMSTAPHVDPGVSRAERYPLREIVADAIDGLTEEQHWIFDALFVRRISLRALGRELSIPKTTVARKRDALLQVLREKLEQEPMIVDYLEAAAAAPNMEAK